MRLLLIRHGESTMNRAFTENGTLGSEPPAAGCELPSPDAALTELGCRQAQRLADHFAAGALPRPDRLYCSLMRRAVETAAPIAAALDLPAFGHLELYEVGGLFNGSYSRIFSGPNPGAVPHPGSTASALQGLNPALVLPAGADESGWYHRDVEPISEGWRRAQRVLAGILDDYGASDAVIACVAHEWIIQYLMRAALSAPPSDDGVISSWWDINNTGTVLIDFPGHRTRRLPEARWVNRTDHLSTADLTD